MQTKKLTRRSARHSTAAIFLSAFLSLSVFGGIMPTPPAPTDPTNPGTSSAPVEPPPPTTETSTQTQPDDSDELGTQILSLIQTVLSLI